MLYASDGIDVSLSFKIDFPYSYNDGEYETFVIELIFVLQIRIQRLCIQDDSKLIIK